MISAPLRISRERIIAYGVALTALCLIQVRFVIAQQYGDWSAFWAAGATAGTPNLLDPHNHAVWQTAHHLLTTIFPYLPGAAWFFVPFKPLSLVAGYAINFAVMAAGAAISAIAAARIYRLPAILALILTFAWAPVTAALSTGQISPVGLLLTLVAIAGMVQNAPLKAGLGVGAMLYKLPYAVFFAVLLIVRRQFTAVAVGIACAMAWYLLSVAATAGDYAWPMHYVGALHAYLGPDIKFNAVKTISIPGFILRAGAPQWVALVAGAVIFGAAVPLLRRATTLEAASFAPLLGLVANPHTLPYDVVLALPALFYIMTHWPEPLRTRSICLVYLLAPLWLLSGMMYFDVLAVICNGIALAWIVKGYNESTSRSDLDFAHT